MPSETSFRSEEIFTQRTFRRWVDALPRSDRNRYELIGGHIVMTPPAGWMHGSTAASIVCALKAHVVRHRLGYVFDSSLGYNMPSPARSKRDRTEKKALYATNGVDEYWVVDPVHRAVTVFSLGPDGYDSGRTVIAGSVRSRVLPKLRLTIAKLFQR
jgi:Uma2 family endonuclease